MEPIAKVQATITKTDDDEHLVFGWGNVAILEDGSTVIDKQGDWWESINELEDMAYDYVLHSRDGGDTHLRKGVATMVESFVSTPEKLESIGLAKDALPQGWWVGFKVDDQEVWDGVKKGRYKGFSIGGVGKREPGHEPVGKVTKRDFTGKEREKAAGKGHALSGGGFPIENEQDLKNAIHAIGRAKNPAAAKAHIIRSAKRLGKTDLIPDGWNVSKADPLIAALHAAAALERDPFGRSPLAKHLPGGHNQKSHGGEMNPLGKAFDKAFAAALSDGHGMSFSLGGSSGGKSAVISTLPPTKADFTQTLGADTYKFKTMDGKKGAVQFDTQGRFKAATFDGQAYSASQGATLKPGKGSAPSKGGVPSQEELGEMAGKPYKGRTDTRAGQKRKQETEAGIKRSNEAVGRGRGDRAKQKRAEQLAAGIARSEGKKPKGPPDHLMTTEEMQVVLGPDSTLGAKVTVTPLGGKPISGNVTGVGDSWVSVDNKHYELKDLDAVKVGAKGNPNSRKIIADAKAKRTGKPASREKNPVVEQAAASRGGDKFEAMMQNDDWQGYGYLGERQNALDTSDPEIPDQSQRVKEVDAAIIRYANKHGVSDDALFEWANSKSGRHFADAAFGSDEPLDDVFSKAEKWGGLPKGSSHRAGQAAASGDKDGMKAAAPAIKSKGKPDGTGTAEDPVAVGKDLDKAVTLLAEGKHVRLDQPDEVATLLGKLAEMANVAKAKGEQAPDIDLCKVSVPGTNLFCHDHRGIPRAQMPQFKGKAAKGSRAGEKVNDDPDMEADIEQEFKDALKVMGIKVTEKRRAASHLRATQSELVGPKVAGMMQAMDAGKIPESPIFVTRDGYIVDGHHRWAAKVGQDLQDNELGDVDMPVLEIDLDIGAALDFANAFALAMGLIPKGTGTAAEGVKKNRLARLLSKRDTTPTPRTPRMDSLAVALARAARTTPCRGCGD